MLICVSIMKNTRLSMKRLLMIMMCFCVGEVGVCVWVFWVSVCLLVSFQAQIATDYDVQILFKASEEI